MNAIDTLFQSKRKVFIPFVTAGDPDLDTTVQVARTLAKSGAGLIEIGFPYSDPIADGSVIQASYTRALARNLAMDDIFALAKTLKREEPFQCGAVPLVGMVSFSLVYHRGPEKFVREAQAAGFSGAIVPDLPVEEGDSLTKIAAASDFKLIQLVTPTTPRERAVQIAQMSTGFLYCVSVVGITGARAELPPELLDQLSWLRKQTKLPLCVGFGISKPEHVKMLRESADGIIVGSALVRLLEKKRPVNELLDDVGNLTRSLTEALK